MIGSISSRVSGYVKSRPVISTALSLGIVNYSDLARKIIADEKLDGKGAFDAVLVALRRLAPSNDAVSDGSKVVSIIRQSSVVVRTKMCSVVVPRHALNAKLERLGRLFYEAGEELNAVNGVRMSTIVAPVSMRPVLEREFAGDIAELKAGLAELAVKSDKSILSTPGVLSFILGRLYERGINVREFGSTWTDTIIVVEESQVQQSLDAIRA